MFWGCVSAGAANVARFCLSVCLSRRLRWWGRGRGRGGRLQVGARREVPLTAHLAGGGERELVPRVHKVECEADELHGEHDGLFAGGGHCDGAWRRGEVEDAGAVEGRRGAVEELVGEVEELAADEEQLVVVVVALHGREGETGEGGGETAGIVGDWHCGSGTTG